MNFDQQKQTAPQTYQPNYGMFLIQRVGKASATFDCYSNPQKIQNMFIFTEELKKSYVIRRFICLLGRAIFRTRKIATHTRRDSRFLSPGSYWFYEVLQAGRSSARLWYAHAGFIRRGNKISLILYIFREIKNIYLPSFIFFILFLRPIVGTEVEGGSSHEMTTMVAKSAFLVPSFEGISLCFVGECGEL